MRMRLALTAAATAMGIVSLACGGVGTESTASGAGEPSTPDATPSGEDLPVLIATSSAMTWPMTDGAAVQGTVLAAIDDDPKSTWRADSGEVGTFWFRKPGATHVRIDAGASQAEVRTMPLKGLSKPSPTDWTSVPADGSWVALPSPDTAVELRFAEATVVRDVAFIGPSPTLGERALSAISRNSASSTRRFPFSSAMTGSPSPSKRAGSPLALSLRSALPPGICGASRSMTCSISVRSPSACSPLSPPPMRVAMNLPS